MIEHAVRGRFRTRTGKLHGILQPLFSLFGDLEELACRDFSGLDHLLLKLLQRVTTFPRFHFFLSPVVRPGIAFVMADESIGLALDERRTAAGTRASDRFARGFVNG